jgi:hypothetical protein
MTLKESRWVVAMVEQLPHAASPCIASPAATHLVEEWCASAATVAPAAGEIVGKILICCGLQRS